MYTPVATILSRRVDEPLLTATFLNDLTVQQRLDRRI
jgi:hypothetical protein